MTTQTELLLIDCRTETVPGGLRIHPEGEHVTAVEPQMYKAPLQAECSLQIDGDGRGVRLLFGAGR